MGIGAILLRLFTGCCLAVILLAMGIYTLKLTDRPTSENNNNPKINADYHQKNSQIQKKRSELACQNVALRHQMDQNPDLCPEFKDFCRATLLNALEKDGIIKDSKARLTGLKEAIEDLDLQAGKSSDRQELEKLLEKLRRLESRCREIKAEINFHTQLLEAQVQRQLWPEYQQNLQTQIDEHKQELDRLNQDANALRTPKLTATPPDPPDPKWAGFTLPQIILLAALALTGIIIGAVLPRTPAGPHQQPDDDYEFPAEDSTNSDSPAWSEPYDKIAANIDKVRTRVPCPTILITGPKPTDVSPRAVINLAIALTYRNRKVLLLETNAGHRELTEIFEPDDFPDNSNGIAETSLPNLYIKPYQENWNETEHYDKLRETFEVILLYAPQALHDEQSTLITAADTTLCLIPPTANRRRQLTKTAQIIADRGGKLLDIFAYPKL